jgi:hypothetical protein
MHKYENNSGCGYFVFLLFILLVVLFCTIAPAIHTTEYVNLKVTDKSYAGDEDSFIIWMEDADGNQYEFTNSDVLLRGKFDSSTVQGKIKVGSTYNIKTCGWRVPFFSWYENIIEYELVE